MAQVEKASKVTNCMVQQKAGVGFDCDNIAGGKLDSQTMHQLVGLRKLLRQSGLNDTKLWDDILTTTATAFAAVPILEPKEYQLETILPQVAQRWAPEHAKFEVSDQCLSVFGVDFVIDSDLKPWLLEIQPGPNCQMTCPQEWPVRDSLLKGLEGLVMEGKSAEYFDPLDINQEPLPGS